MSTPDLGAALVSKTYMQSDPSEGVCAHCLIAAFQNSMKLCGGRRTEEPNMASLHVTSTRTYIT